MIVEFITGQFPGSDVWFQSASQHLKVRLTKAIAIWQTIFHLLKLTYAAKKEMSKEAAEECNLERLRLILLVGGVGRN